MRSVSQSALARAASRRSRAVTMAAANGSDFYPHKVKTIGGCTLEATLTRLGSRFETVPLDQSSPYIKPASILYELDGKQRRWDVVQSMDSVGVILHHRGLDAFVLVRQFRPAVYAHKAAASAAAGAPAPPMAEGFTYELCAGLIDKDNKALEEIVVEEIAEECGFQVDPSAVRRVGSAVSSTGMSGADHVIYFAQVDESMRTHDGGGLQETGEAIEVLGLPFAQAHAFALDCALPKSPGLMFGLVWAHGALSPGGVLAGLRDSRGLETGELELRAVGMESDQALLLKSVLPS